TCASGARTGNIDRGEGEDWMLSPPHRRRARGVRSPRRDCRGRDERTAGRLEKDAAMVKKLIAAGRSYSAWLSLRRGWPGISAFTRVFRRAMPGHDAEGRNQNDPLWRPSLRISRRSLSVATAGSGHVDSDRFRHDRRVVWDMIFVPEQELK